MADLFAGGRGTATYAASKALLTSFSETLNAELRPHGVHVTAVCPGFTGIGSSTVPATRSSGVPDVTSQSASDAAVCGLRSVARNRAVAVPGVANRIGAWLLDTLPGAVRRSVVAKLPR